MAARTLRALQMMGIRPLATEAAKPVGLLYANVRKQGAGEHCEDQDAGADAELGFEFHAVPDQSGPDKGFRGCIGPTGAVR